jgi:uncharacterized protein YdeI (YjbR/CyaY-like superfamily)
MRAIYFNNRNDWRNWLKENHDKEKEVWLIYFKKNIGKPSIPYEESVEEALCFGWIDSIIKKMDDEKYARKFTPRTDYAKWSESNKARIRKLIKQGKMTEFGLAKITKSAFNRKEKTQGDELKKKMVIPGYLKQALMKNKKAMVNFEKLAPSHKRQYLGWIMSAKKQDTRIRRIKEAIGLLTQNKKLGLK